MTVVRIGCISDTHIPVAARELPLVVFEIFSGVDMIFHAGDILEFEVIKSLEEIAPVYAVAGNMDYAETAASLPNKNIIKVNDRRIGLTHGSGAPYGILTRIRREFADVDCIVFGHTHTSMAEEISGIYYFNPGSPTDKRFTDVNSVGILEVSDTIRGRILTV